MIRERSLSDFWREDLSDDRVMELASVLRGADSLIGVMGSGVQTTWAVDGKSTTWWMKAQAGQTPEMLVTLDYSPLADLLPPFGGRAVDEVIGYAAHEGGHCLWSNPNGRDAAQNILKNNYYFQTMRNPALHDPNNINCRCPVCEVLRIDNILEDAFIDYHVGKEWPVLGEYIRWSRKRIADERPIDYDVIARQAHPDRNHIINLWIACSLYDKSLPDKMSARVQDAMTFLMSKSIMAVKTDDVDKRMLNSVECWEYLAKRFPANDAPLPRQAPPTPQQGGQSGQGGQGQGQGQGKAEKSGVGDKKADSKDQTEDKGKGGAGDKPESKPEGDDEGTGKEEKPGTGKPEAGGKQGGDDQGKLGNLDDFDIRGLGEVPEKIIKAVMDAISHEIEDLSQSVAEAMNVNAHNVKANTRIADYDGPAADRVRKEIEPQIQEMRRVFDRQKAVKSRDVRGLTSGKLDTRSLARVGTGNFRVYKRRDVVDTPDIAIGLLLDVSGSMQSNMNIVWATAGIFAEALIRKQGVNFLCLTYTGGSSNCQTTRLCDKSMGRLCLGNVAQGGGTPSGPAIASIKVLMGRMRERQKVIIHFTDGSPDSSDMVRRAVEDARKAGYSVWAIGTKGLERTLESQYGTGDWETIGNIRELPSKIAELVDKLTK